MYVAGETKNWKSAYRNIFADWGHFRVPLEPQPQTKTYGRKGFYLHGGRTVGSKGCIDVGKSDLFIYFLFKNHLGPVKVYVKYPTRQ